MLTMDELIPLKLYPAKRKVFVPFIEKDKKNGSAVFLMGTTQEENEKLMNMRYVYDPSKFFKSYYVDRDVMTYINSDAINDLLDDNEEFDELQEAVLSEGIIHTKPSKLNVLNGSTMDNQIINDIYSKDRIDDIVAIMGAKECPVKFINVQFYSNPEKIHKAANMPDGEYAYSFSDDTTIHILSYYSYDKNMDGPYEAYALNELICFLAHKIHPETPDVIVQSVAMALSGQMEYFREDENSKKFKYYEEKKKDKKNLYLADVIYEIYLKKGPLGIRRIMKKDLTDINREVSGRIMADIKDLYNKYYTEATLTAEDKKRLKDSDYGLPSKKKYPMPDADHVRAAIKFFNHCDKEDEAELAKNIKAKMRKYDVDVKIGDGNRLSKYINEAATECEFPIPNYPGLEKGLDDKILMGNHSKEYYDVVKILDGFTADEFRKVSFYSTYQDSKYIAKRIIHYDINGVPESFMDIYHFPSEPTKAQITLGVAPFARGKHLVTWMFNELINSGWAEENNVETYIWHANPENKASIHIATTLGFKGSLDEDKLDKYGRHTFTYHIDPPKSEVVKMPEIKNESGFMLTESAGFIFNEADSKYDRKIKKYLYKERLRNAGQVLSIYDQIKSRNPKITKTFRTLKAYKGLNVYVDTSYYHDLYLKNAPKGNNKRTLYMYFDFLSRLMENEEVKKMYKKITYFFPVKASKPGMSMDALTDWTIDLNVLSVITFLLKKDPEVLKRWAGKDIVFLGETGYFKIDFSTLSLKNMNKFKKNIKKIISKEEIPDVDEDDDILSQTLNSSKGNAVEAIDVIERETGIKINNLSALDIKLNHLSMNDSIPKGIASNPEGTAILIVGADSEEVISEIKSDALKSKEITAYYKMK